MGSNPKPNTFFQFATELYCQKDENKQIWGRDQPIFYTICNAQTYIEATGKKFYNIDRTSGKSSPQFLCRRKFVCTEYSSFLFCLNLHVYTWLE